MAEKKIDRLLEVAGEAVNRGDRPTALKKLLEACDLEPGHVGVLTGVGENYVLLGQPDRAIPYFARASVRAADKPEAHNNLGVAYMFARDFLNAERSFKAALQVDGDNVQTLRNMAFLYLQQDERLAESVEILAGLVRADPRDADALYMLGQCYELAGDRASAQFLYEKLLEVNPEHPQGKAALESLASQR